MPGLLRKLLIFAAVDGLILQSQQQHVRGQSDHNHHSSSRRSASVKIAYGSHNITRLGGSSAVSAHDNSHDMTDSSSWRSGLAAPLEAYGIVGLLRIFNHAYLISITRRTQVAQIWGKPVYAITGVAIIPLSSQKEAQKNIDEARESVEWHRCHDGAAHEEDDSSDASDVGEQEERLDVRTSGGADLDSRRTSKDDTDLAEPPSPAGRRASGIVEEVVGKSGSIGKTAGSWLASGIGWSAERLRSGTTKVRGGNTATSSTTSIQEMQDMEHAHDETQSRVGEMESGTAAAAAQEGSTARRDEDHMINRVLPRVVQTMKLLLNSQTFFFSYDIDLTRNLSSKTVSRVSEVPLHKQADEEYFFNQQMLETFIEHGHTDYCLPIMQGFIGQRQFSTSMAKTTISHQDAASTTTTTIEEESTTSITGDTHGQGADLESSASENTFLLTLISRRSLNRAGLRFLRRGVDENGNTANFNETEQILSSPDWSSLSPTFSFLQVRGSIPVFFSQTPYTFKPLPVMSHSDDANNSAVRKHFSDLMRRYGTVHAVSLVDRHGTEVHIGESYDDRVKKLNEDGGIGGQTVGFDWFEFHKVCSGMRFDKVSQLVDELEQFLEHCSWTMLSPTNQASAPPLQQSLGHAPRLSISSNFSPAQMQSGVVRTNCMDCLDRTNVVQSAFGAHILTQQLQKEYGISIDFQHDPSTSWFNTLWADNGDAISRAYAGTAALKGDYTRTRKRDTLGALTDLSLTLSRYRKGLFDDGFAQGVIDFVLGYVDEEVFTEFETNLANKDLSIDIGKARQAQISMAADVVLGGTHGNVEEPNQQRDPNYTQNSEDEDLISGWSLLTPHSPSTLRSLPFDEIVLLLTNQALYIVRFDPATSKVGTFERIPHNSISDISYGAYVTETNVASQMDEKKNAGFVVRYVGRDVRMNTRSLDSNVASAPSTTVEQSEPHAREHDKKDKPSDAHFLAFKALPTRSAAVGRKGHSHASSSLSSPIGSPISSPVTATFGSGVGVSQQQVPVERDVVRQICEEIEQVIAKAGSPAAGNSSGKAAGRDVADDERKVKLREEDVITAENAKANAGLIEKVGYRMKRFVWG